MNYSAALGAWNGTLTVDSYQLILLFNFIYVNSYLKGYWDVPAQSVFKIPFDDITVQNDHIAFNVTNIHFAGNFSENKEEITGLYEQNGYKLELTLKKYSNVSVYNVSRPQTPIRPFSYIEEAVKIHNTKANVILDGILTYMNNTQPIALVLLAHGSGGHDKDESIYEHKPFMVIADHLTKNNIAVLRYDERGIGKSTGNFNAASDVDFAEDILAGIGFAHTHEIMSNVTNIGVIGHSKGGATALISKKLSNLIRFIVFLGSIGTDGETILLLQSKLIMKADNYSDAYIDTILSINRGIYQVLKRESDIDKIRVQLNTYFDNLIASASNEYDRLLYEQVKKNTLKEVASLSSPWFRSFLAFDPRPILVETRIPVLGLWGSKDLQVPANENYAEMKKALEKAKNKNFELKILPSLNHLFQHSMTGSPNEYDKIEETFSVEALEMMNKWIIKNAAMSCYSTVLPLTIFSAFLSFFLF